MQCRVDFNICLMLKMESAKQVQEDTCTGSGSFTRLRTLSFLLQYTNLQTIGLPLLSVSEPI